MFTVAATIVIGRVVVASLKICYFTVCSTHIQTQVHHQQTAMATTTTTTIIANVYFFCKLTTIVCKNFTDHMCVTNLANKKEKRRIANEKETETLAVCALAYTRTPRTHSNGLAPNSQTYNLFYLEYKFSGTQQQSACQVSMNEKKREKYYVTLMCVCCSCCCCLRALNAFESKKTKKEICNTLSVKVECESGLCSKFIKM